jgi:Domain of unknown function (DUF4386)
MNDPRTSERSILRWGGLAGILGGIFFVLSFVVVIGFQLPDPADPKALTRFPDIKVARTLENSLYLVALILWVTVFLALYQGLKRTSPAPALFGASWGILGLVVLAAGALPHVASAPISDLYHAPGATAEDKATLVLIWQAAQGIFEALLTVGILLVSTGIIALGVAMLRAPAFGRGLGWASVVLGVVGVVAGSFDLVDPPSPIAAVGILALVVFQLVLGWKAYRLSRDGSG